MSSWVMDAQEKMIVSGTVMASYGEPLSFCQVYSFATVAEGKEEFERIRKAHEEGDSYSTQLPYDLTFSDGYYETVVADSGSLIFYLEPFEPVFVKVNRRNRVDVEIDATLPGGIDHGLLKYIKVEPRDPRYADGTLYCHEIFKMPSGKGGEKVRLVIRPALVSADNSVLHEFRPVVVDGGKFHRHAKKYLRYDGAEAASLLEIAEQTQVAMSSDRFDVEWEDEVALDPAIVETVAGCRSVVTFETSRFVFHEDTLYREYNIRRPMLLLDKLDPALIVCGEDSLRTVISLVDAEEYKAASDMVLTFPDSPLRSYLMALIISAEDNLDDVYPFLSSEDMLSEAYLVNDRYLSLYSDPENRMTDEERKLYEESALLMEDLGVPMSEEERFLLETGLSYICSRSAAVVCYLAQCFRTESAFIEIARADGYLHRSLVKEASDQL